MLAEAGGVDQAGLALTGPLGAAGSMDIVARHEVLDLGSGGHLGNRRVLEHRLLFAHLGEASLSTVDVVLLVTGRLTTQAISLTHLCSELFSVFLILSLPLLKFFLDLPVLLSKCLMQFCPLWLKCKKTSCGCVATF